MDTKRSFPVVSVLSVALLFGGLAFVNFRESEASYRAVLEMAGWLALWLGGLVCVLVALYLLLYKWMGLEDTRIIMLVFVLLLPCFVVFQMIFKIGLSNTSFDDLTYLAMLYSPAIIICIWLTYTWFRRKNGNDISTGTGGL